MRMLTTMSPFFFVIVSTLPLAYGRVIDERTDPTPSNDPIKRQMTGELTDGQTTNVVIKGEELEFNDLVKKNTSEDLTNEKRPTHLAIDELIALASPVDSTPVSEGHEFETRQELDMWLTREQYEAIHGQSMLRQRRKAHYDLSRRWTNQQVMYRRQPGVFSFYQWRKIEAAMQEFEELTCLTFHEDVDKTHNNFVYFVTGEGCSSYVGMIGGSQKVTLAPGCITHSVIMHEIGHAIGFFHEQSRPDRDAYVQILFENVKPSKRRWFQKYPSYKINYYNVPYDYYSVMHYSSTAFSENGKYTIKTIDPLYQDVVGYPDQLSFYDVMLANRMYRCDAKCDHTHTCPPNAFRGKDCKCYCRGVNVHDPVQECNQGPVDVTTSRPSSPATRPDCRDLAISCSNWVRSSQILCVTNHDVKRLCLKSCGRCGSIETTTPLTRSTSTARPTTTTTSTTPSTTTIATTASTTTGCHDDMSACPTLASSSFNYCVQHERVKLLCKKSCGICSTDAGTTTRATTTRPTTTRPTTTRATTTRATTTTITPQKTSTTTQSPCNDESRACHFWAKVPGLCRTNDTVKRICKKSCRTCTVG